MAATKGPELVGFSEDLIPSALRAQKRWAPWRAVFDPKRGKYDKIPVSSAQPEHGISTKTLESWGTFADAVRAHDAAEGMTAGVGYVMTGPHGIVGVDLDDALKDGALTDWAAEIVQRLGGYAEVSPSGRGVRVFVRGEIPADWTNHEIGVEVYAGHAPRFLTVTGRRLPGSAPDATQAPAGALDWLATTHKRARATPGLSAAMAEPMPDLLPVEVLPVNHEINHKAGDFLRDGAYVGDRSRTLHGAAVALFGCGHSLQEVFSILAHNPHAMDVALDHRRHVYERALVYLWVEHCLKAKPKASRVLVADDFEDFAADYAEGTDPDEAPAPPPADGFEDFSQDAPPAPPPAPAKPPRFQFLQAGTFVASRRRLGWLVPGLLPCADLSAVFGASGSGKTFFVLDLVAHVATGQPWQGRKVTQARVAYIVAEGAIGFRDRVQAWCDFHGVEPEDLDLYVLPDTPNFLEKTDVVDLVRQLRVVAPGLVVVDTLAQVVPGAAENSSEDMGRALAHCRAIRKATGAPVLLVAHSGKDGARGLRGWSGIKGALDSEIEVTRTEAYRAATVTKLKDGRGEGDEFLFDLDERLVEAGDLASDEPHDDDVFSCVVQYKDAAQSTAARQDGVKLGGKQRILWDVARELCADGEAVPVAAIVDHPDALDAAKHRTRRVEQVAELADKGLIELLGDGDDPGEKLARIASQAPF